MPLTKDLLSIEELSRSDIEAILAYADQCIDRNRSKDKRHLVLQGKSVILLFFENSTRTQVSFMLAAKRLGIDVIPMNMDYSSLKKGETLLDTALNLQAMNPDFIVIRHPKSGAVHLIAQKIMNCSIINAGDGSHEHPTQALLDALTIMRKKKRIDGLTVTICGDILHSRVARSNIHLLTKMGANVRVVAPPTLLPPHIEELGVTATTNMLEGLKDADIIMMLRLQNERMQGCFLSSPGEYFHFYGLDSRKLSHAKEDALIMHPGPINRGVEIDSAVADDIHRSLILDQVEMGVAVRQAIFELLSKHQQ